MNRIDLHKLKAAQAPAPEEKPESILNRIFTADIQLFGSFGDKQKEAFYHGMGILLEAGVDIKSAFDLTIGQQTNKKHTRLLGDMKEHVIQGMTLSKAMQQHRDFTPYEYHSVQIGEETGQLASVMLGVAAFYRKRLKQRRQVTGAMLYPIMVTLTSLAVVFFMLHFIVPMFADIFQRSGNKLPSITQFIVSASVLVKAYALPFIIVIALITIWLYRQKNKVWFRKNMAKLMLKTPVLGQLVRKIYLSRFCSSMALLTGSKVSLTRSLELCRQMVAFYPIEQSLMTVERSILMGAPLHQSLGQHAIYDRKLISLIKVGEEVNRLPDFFVKIAEQYQEEIEHQSASLSTVLEPFIIIFLGIFVGLILIAMYLPLFQLGSGFN